MKDKLCDLCASKGLKKKLVYCHVNFEEAMLLCENSMCVYPFGSSDVCSLLVRKRSTTSNNNAEKNRKSPKISERGTVERTDHTSSIRIAPQFYWSNSDSLCWLDSIMTVLVNNRCLQLCLDKLQPKQSILQKLCDKFMEAQRLGPVENGRTLLKEARSEVFEFLKSKMQCELGVNDSPLVSLNILLKDNPQINEKFMQEYKWSFKCTSCGYVQVDRHKKSIVTFPNTSHDFCMPSGFFVRPCYKCKSAGQRSTLEFQQMPPCVLVHFVEGVCNEEFLKSRFLCQGKDYELCQLIQYKRSPDHFVSWVRNLNGIHWAEVDDIKDAVCDWREGFPSVPVNEIHIAVWERASFYQKNSILTKYSEITTSSRRQEASQQALNGDNSQAVSTQSPRIKMLKDPPLLRRKESSQGAFGTCNRQVGVVACKAVKRLGRKDNPNVVGEAFFVNKEDLKENSGGKRREVVDKFEPYIPRKKRNIAEEAATINSDISENTVDFSKLAKDERIGSRNGCVDKSTNFLPYQDGISIHLVEKQQSIVCDNQSDSGYSSPGSNSSCASLTMPSVKEEVPNLDKFLGSLCSMDLPDIVNLARHDTNHDVCQLTVSENNEDAVNIDDILREIFPEEQFQNDISKTMSDIIDDIVPSLPLVLCDDLDHFLADI